MRIAMTGSSGLIGSALVPRLRADGHEVVRLVRRPPSGPDEVRWDPDSGQIDSSLGVVDAAVNLAGAGVGDHRWTDSYKELIRSSRVNSTRTLVTALQRMDPLPKVLVSASAIGYYGDHGDQVLTEESPAGSGFLSGVVVEWEAAAEPAREAGIRVAYPRSGLVMTPKGGALGRLLPLLKLGLAGPLGSGNQYWSWITLEDEVSALRHLLVTDGLEGAFNLTAPTPVTQSEFVRALARVAHRPALLPAPSFALRLALGEFASEVLDSERVIPQRLLQSGFAFASPDVDSAATALLNE
ncbi:MAG: TIGR01777 family oxidoreductase [Actinomycetes bacterium]